MKLILIALLATVTLAGYSQQKPPKKEPPKVIYVKKSPPEVVDVKEVKAKTPKKFRNKPVPKVVKVKYAPVKEVKH